MLIGSVLVAFGIIVGLGVAVGGFILVLEGAFGDGPFLLAPVGVVMMVATLAALIYVMAAESDRGPCLRTETGMAYNAATKTMMPYTRCAERGEWVK